MKCLFDTDVISALGKGVKPLIEGQEIKAAILSISAFHSARNPSGARASASTPKQSVRPRISTKRPRLGTAPSERSWSGCQSSPATVASARP